jgi:phosphoribosylformylglycinamidine cyclo-ligase
VGTKLKVAFAMDRHDTIGIDCVAMCCNDVAAQGAEPLFFLDYLAVGRMDPGLVDSVVKGVAEGCRRAGCALLGGETAEMPGLYREGEYDLAGFAVGAAPAGKLLDPARVKAGDALVGLSSTGLHSNGYSLARKALLEEGGMSLDTYRDELGRTLGEELLEPTALYSSAVLYLRDSHGLTGAAHITGGGLIENVPRCLPPGLGAVIRKGSWMVPAIFPLIAGVGPVREAEMFRVFNMGVGLVAVVPAGEGEAAVEGLRARGHEARIIGEVTGLREGQLPVTLL